ncbi:sensor histidine kinase [Sphaerisporangium album]|uniref:sensor histidine kinase n=1 Tax=Sphaerisporangium album TaxID=509200 RepID=UPI0015F08A3E|nr:ATP-binding protein [Sphaerisporangium album]
MTNLREISRLEAGVIGRHDLLNLAVLVDGELDHRQSKIGAVRRFSSGVMVYGERIGLTRLLHNLMDNAERHARSVVMVTVEHRGDAAVLEVYDDGSGVPREQREIIFERYARLQDACAKDTGGSGLVLPIARQIAEDHGGTLTLEDSPSGARFVARFPPASRVINDRGSSRWPREAPTRRNPSSQTPPTGSGRLAGGRPPGPARLLSSRPSILGPGVKPR